MDNIEIGKDHVRVYTVSEVAQLLKVSRNTAYKLVKQHLFVSKKIGTEIRILKDSFDSWLKTQGEEKGIHHG